MNQPLTLQDVILYAPIIAFAGVFGLRAADWLVTLSLEVLGAAGRCIRFVLEVLVGGLAWAASPLTRRYEAYRSQRDEDAFLAELARRNAERERERAREELH